jgi:hypothetical protein
VKRIRLAASGGSTTALYLVLTPISAILSWVNHRSYVQHRLEAFDLCVNLLAIFGHQGCELVDDHSQSQGVVSWHAVDLFSLVLNLVEFLMNRP